jgi:hypothetical protein
MSIIILAVSGDKCYYKKHFFSLKFVTKAETEMSCEICQLTIARMVEVPGAFTQQNDILGIFWTT